MNRSSSAFSRSAFRLVLLAAAFGLAACKRTTEPEVPDRTSGTPAQWGGGTAVTGGYQTGLDRGIAHGGTAAAYITSIGAPSGFSSLTQGIRADDYRGKRVRWSGWVRTLSVDNYAALWLRVDGFTRSLAFDNMADASDRASGRTLTGTMGWTHVSIVLDVPENAALIFGGALLAGRGDLLVDDLTFETVGTSVPVTKPVVPNGTFDSTAIAATAANAPSAFRNLDFEGNPPIAATAVAWLNTNAVPFATTTPSADVSDLAAFGAMVGSARVVGLGEGTHGTREFFQVKHRFLQYLVKTQGFTLFGIEATWPEANNLNQYVLTGSGDPRALLASLKFWTWNTQEVLDMILWMRQWNTTAPASQRVQFLGFDMQYPRLALDSVEAVIGRADPASSALVNEKLACIRAFGGDSPRGSAYAAQVVDVRRACRLALQEVYDLMVTKRSVIEGATSAGTYAMALQSMRHVQQFEQESDRTKTTDVVPQSRDQSMAENVKWLLDQGGPNAKIVLWAHNEHIGRFPGRMGRVLSDIYGSSYVNLGFLFGDGAFNAVETGRGLQAHTIARVPVGSLEEAFYGTGKPRLLLDARRIASGGAAAAPLAGPVIMRTVGALFIPGNEGAFVRTTILPRDFDILTYIAKTTATVLLPF